MYLLKKNIHTTTMKTNIRFTFLIMKLIPFVLLLQLCSLASSESNMASFFTSSLHPLEFCSSQFVYTTSPKFMASTVASTAEGSSINWELQQVLVLIKNCLFGKETNYLQSVKVLEQLLSSAMICFYILFHIAINTGQKDSLVQNVHTTLSTIPACSPSFLNIRFHIFGRSIVNDSMHSLTIYPHSKGNHGN